MNKNNEYPDETISSERVLEIIKTAQMRTSNRAYSEWISPETKNDFGIAVFVQCKRFIKFICTFFIAIISLWFFVIIVHTFDLGDSKNLIWFHDLMKNAVQVCLFKIIPAIAIFISGNYVGSKKK